VILEPVPPEQDVLRADLPGMVVDRHGISPYELADRGVKLSRITSMPLGINDSIIDRARTAIYGPFGLVDGVIR
jgi:hypothetical protein